jgi:diguanylate cyclase (GGDEF)-like protein
MERVQLGVAIASMRQPVLVVLNGPQIGERKRLSGTVEIGRDPGAGIVLRDAEVAWRHVRLVCEGGQVTLSGLDGGGVELNGAVVERAVLSVDDRIQIGKTVLRFELHGPIEQAFDDAVEERLSRDELTGLLSRRKFELELGARLDAACAAGTSIGIVALDLDRLKQVNDRHGHLVGARVISEVGRAIGEALVPGAFACRMGGDEFAVALTGAGAEEIEALARAIQAALPRLGLEHDGERLEVGISGGIAVGPSQGADPTSLIRAADDALLRAKREGRGRLSR